MSITDVVTANTSFSAGTRAVTKGETFHASDPIVQGREECFDPFKVDNEIEQATAAPGKKRSTRIRKSRPETTEATTPQSAAEPTGEATEGSTDTTDYSEMKQPELKALLVAKGIEYPSGVVSNETLRNLLSDCQG